MSKESIESRRAFMRNAGKALGSAAAVAAFMAVNNSIVKADPSEDNPITACTSCGGCGGCWGTCSGTCSGACSGSCSGTCSGSCDSSR